MGQPVVHFEVVGKDSKLLQGYYAELFDWEIDTDNQIGYGTVAPDGAGIGGGVWGDPDPGHVSHVTFYVQVPDVEAALVKAERLGGTRVFGPDMVPGTEIELGQLADPEGNRIGVMRPPA